MSNFLSKYTSVIVLILLCVYYSIVTVDEQHPMSASAGRGLAATLKQQGGDGARVLVIARPTTQDEAFADAVRTEAEQQGLTVVEVVHGTPVDARKALVRVGEAGVSLDFVATNHPASQWGPLQQDRLERLATEHEALRNTKVVIPESYIWPSFLTPENLLNVIKQNADIAIIAIGMTLVIITSGIDLSVGSLLALSGVMTAVAIQQRHGGADAGTFGLLMGSFTGIGLCMLCGVFNGGMITYFKVPAFVVTLAMMMIARGAALIVAVDYQRELLGGSTEGTPEAVKVQAESFGWLGNGVSLGIPNPIWLMIVLYVVFHIIMTQTSLGRYIYAVGGNKEAARLSGVPVTGVLILVYVICGAMAGLAGIVDASRFEGGRPNAGEMYELQVIAAVVVGGTSLAGGEGRIMGTLVGALIIAIIQNGMNMAGVPSYEQKVVFGGLILVAAVLDSLRHNQFLSTARRFLSRGRPSSETPPNSAGTG